VQWIGYTITIDSLENTRDTFFLVLHGNNGFIEVSKNLASNLTYMRNLRGIKE